MDKPESLLKNDRYQIFLMTCHCCMPVAFARHMWFVVNEKGKLTRWEVLFEKHCCGTSWGHLYKNAQEPFKPLGFFTTQGMPLWKSELLGVIEGDENSAAFRMSKFIKDTVYTYPHKKIYHLTGPNSNTYIQWVLNRFPEFIVDIPWNAVGTHYKAKV